MFTPILQVSFEKRSLKLDSILGVILVFIGLLFLSSKETDFLNFFMTLGSDFHFGDFLTLICALFFAGYIVYLDIISNKADFLHIVWLQILVTAMGSLTLMFAFEISNIEEIRFTLNWQVLKNIIYTSIFATLIITFLQTKFQKFTIPTRTAIIFTSEPLLASILAYLILNESVCILGVIGGILIII